MPGAQYQLMTGLKDYTLSWWRYYCRLSIWFLLVTIIRQHSFYFAAQ